MDEKVEIRGTTFFPSVVRIPLGGSVTWVNLDPNSDHNATGIGSNFPQTGDLVPGTTSAAQTFPEMTSDDGIEYQCTIHPGMRGRVVVTAAISEDESPAPEPSPDDERSDFEPEEWRAIAHEIAAAWVYDMADDFQNVLIRHEVSEDDERAFIKETFEYVKSEWDAVERWWRELNDDASLVLFDQQISISERRNALLLSSKDRLEALGRQFLILRANLSPLVERWPNPLRPDQEERGPSGKTMFPGQSTSAFGAAITVNGLNKPLRDAYMDHQNFAGTAFGILQDAALGKTVTQSAIRSYKERKAVMSPLHYRFLAMHQYSNLKRLSREKGETDVEAFSRHLWPFCYHGEMDASHFSWWHWLRFIDAHLTIIETGRIPDIVDLPDNLADEIGLA